MSSDEHGVRISGRRPDALDEIGMLHLAGRIADRRQRWQVDRPGVICGHCGMQMRGFANVNGVDVCHAEAPYPDCYRLVTVYGEELGSRKAERR